MTTETTTQHEAENTTSRAYRPLRTWIPLLFLAAMPAIKFIPPMIEDAPNWLMFGSAIGPGLLGILALLWWITFSRALWKERLFGFLGVALMFVLVFALSHPSMRDIPSIFLVTVPMGLAALALGLVLLGRQRPVVRTIVPILLAGIGFGYSALTRNEGMRGNASFDLTWRWTPSPEEQWLLAKQPGSSEVRFSADQIRDWISEPEWSEFRGPGRDGVYTGPAIETDWAANPPVRLWKIPVGPGWSSFVVAGQLLFTQEQRGPAEAIVCYSAESGDEVWVQQIESRFEESLGGPGPRATPTLLNGSLFVQGANGQLIRLNASNGNIVWTTDLREVAGRQPPYWGFSSSPLVVGSVVIVHAGGEGDLGTLAFDIESGTLNWSAPSGDHSYSSPQLIEFGGQQHVAMLTNKELTLLDPSTGEVRLNYPWEHDGYRSLQPALVGNDSLLLPTGLGTGTRRIRLSNEQAGWSVEERWTSRAFKPDFNDLIVHDGHIYGFDVNIFTCIDLETGERVWKRGRYGNGQVLFLKESETLLVVSEKGELVLLKADPAGHQELARIPALDGKTWNHPVVVGDRLYVRNAREAACYKLTLATTGMAAK